MSTSSTLFRRGRVARSPGDPGVRWAEIRFNPNSLLFFFFLFFNHQRSACGLYLIVAESYFFRRAKQKGIYGIRPGERLLFKCKLLRGTQHSPRWVVSLVQNYTSCYLVKLGRKKYIQQGGWFLRHAKHAHHHHGNGKKIQEKKNTNGEKGENFDSERSRRQHLFGY